MTDHHFRVGQLVTLDPGDPSAPGDGRTYKILQLLPEAWGVKHYRIKSIAEPADRIVPENLLTDDTLVRHAVGKTRLAGSLRTAASPALV